MPQTAVHAVTSSADLERELKFLVPEERTAFLRGWLQAVCHPDTRYPPARVVTVYYDTPALALLDEKVNSDYLKRKVRVRWYASLSGQPAEGEVFLECKFRVGSVRHKVRVRANERAADVDRWSFTRPEWKTLVDPLRNEGVDLPADLLPVMRIRYVRERLVDPLSQGRVALDSDMTLDAVNPLRLTPGMAGRLPILLVEYKGTAPEPPPHLRQVLLVAGARRASFSKYLAAFLHSTQTAL
jgi:hypothetical protein